MTKPNKLRFLIDLLGRRTAIWVIFLATAGMCKAQQTLPPLQISSPATGFVINPGQTLAVTVTSPANVPFTQVGVVGHDPFGFSNIAASVPAQFSFAVPADVACGTYTLTAYAATATGQSARSATVLIDVERPDLPTSLSALMPAIYFESPGELSPVVVHGTFSDGSVLDVTRSSNLRYVSSNTSIATVDSSGIVKAISAGATTVTATYTLAGKNVQIAVPVSVPSPVLTVAPASLTFANQNIGTSSPPQQVTLMNSSAAPLKVISVRTTGDFSETDNCVTSSPLAAAASCAVSITFRPTAVGPRTGGLTIANGFNITPATFSLTGVGICHYVSFSASPSTVPRGSNTLLTSTLMSCANTAQTITVQFALTAPAQGNCSATNSLMFTTPPFTLQPNISQTFSFFAQVPSGICPGPYTVVATTLVNGQTVDTSTATLTVTP